MCDIDEKTGIGQHPAKINKSYNCDIIFVDADPDFGFWYEESKIWT